MRGSVLLGTLLCLSPIGLLAPAPGRATTFAQMSEDDLVESADAIVEGRVRTIWAAGSEAGGVFTYVELQQLDVHKGAFSAPTLFLREFGGALGTLVQDVEGAATFELGERVLVFLRIDRRTGALQPSHMALSKYRLADDTIAFRSTDAPTLGGHAADQKPLPEFRARIRAKVGAGKFEVRSRMLERASRETRRLGEEAPEQAHGANGATSRALGEPLPLPYNYSGYRWNFSASMSFLTDDRGAAKLGLDGSRQAIARALDLWTGIPDASIALALGGTFSGPYQLSCSGRERWISFENRGGNLSRLVRCTGVLGVTARCRDELRPPIAQVWGIAFPDTGATTITLNKGLERCGFDLTRILAHEVGHAIGLDHSSEDQAEQDPNRQSALMYFELGPPTLEPTLARYDVNAVVTLYPEAWITAPPAYPPPPSFDPDQLALAVRDVGPPGRSSRRLELSIRAPNEQFALIQKGRWRIQGPGGRPTRTSGWKREPPYRWRVRARRPVDDVTFSIATRDGSRATKTFALTPPLVPRSVR